MDLWFSVVSSRDDYQKFNKNEIDQVVKLIFGKEK